MDGRDAGASAGVTRHPVSERKPTWTQRARGLAAVALIVLVGFAVARGLMFVADRITGKGAFPKFLAPIEIELRGETDRARIAAAFTRRLQDAFPAGSRLADARDALLAGGFEAAASRDGEVRYRAGRRTSFACEDVFTAILTISTEGTITAARGEATPNCL